MLDDYCIRIRRAENGYSVTMTDPKIVAKNAKRTLKNTSGPYDPWIDPERTYVFTDKKAATDFLMTNIDKALPEKDPDKAYETSFNELTKESK